MNVKLFDKNDMSEMLRLRQELIRNVRNDNTITLSDDFLNITKDYLSTDNSISAIAYDNNKAVGCATLCLIRLIPTADHPTGVRAHLMNVYVDEKYRRQGIAREMLTLLLAKAQEKGVTGVSLDATESGKPLYEALGFRASNEHMEIKIR